MLKLLNTKCLLNRNTKCFCLIIHPSVFCCLSGSGLWGQQTKQRCHSLPLPGYFNLFFQVNTKAFPRPIEGYNLSILPWVCWRPSSFYEAWNTLPRRHPRSWGPTSAGSFNVEEPYPEWPSSSPYLWERSSAPNGESSFPPPVSRYPYSHSFCYYKQLVAINR